LALDRRASGSNSSSDVDRGDLTLVNVHAASAENTDSSGSSVSIDHVTVVEMLCVAVCETNDVSFRDRQALTQLRRPALSVALSLRYGESHIISDTAVHGGTRSAHHTWPVWSNSQQQLTLRWNERLSLDALVCDLPREAYLDIRLLVHYEATTRIVGCARLPVFDHTGTLRHGLVNVALWPCDTLKAENVTGPLKVPFVDNLSGSGTVIALAFDNRADQVGGGAGGGGVARVGREAIFLPPTAQSVVVWRRRMSSSSLPGVTRIAFDTLSDNVKTTLDDCVRRLNASSVMTTLERRSLWQWRRALTERIAALPLVVRAAPIDGGSLPSVIDELHGLLRVWRTPELALLAVPLLSDTFVDAAVRRWAVMQLETARDDDLLLVMRTLVEAVRNELYHDSALVRFLLRRSILSPRVGQRFYWLLCVDMQRDPMCTTRFGVVLEAYLRAAPVARLSLTRQQEFILLLSRVVGRLTTSRTSVRDRPRADGDGASELPAHLKELSRALAVTPIECPLDCA
jgi:hypothetical protein